MAGNPLVPQGTINRLIASVIWPSFPNLNVTPAYLGEEAIRLSLDGVATTRINTMTGTVTSPEPYMGISVRMALLMTQSLSDLYKKQMETSTLLGDGTVRPVTTTLSPYPILNASIEGVEPLDFGGKQAGWVVTVGGYYLTNSALWGAV